MYTLESDLQGNPDDACLVVNASARIVGNGHTLEGPGDGETVGIRVEEGSVRVFDITLSGWDGVAIEHVRGEFRFEDSTVRNNGDGYHREWRAVTEMQNVEFTNNDGTAISTRYSKDFRAHDIVVSNNGGTGLSLWGGGRAVVTSSEFNNNGGTGILVGDRVLAEVSNVEINGNDDSGLALSSSIHTAQVVMDDSSITNNGGDGINGLSGITDEFKRQVTLENVNIQGNDRKAIAAYDPGDTEGEHGSLVEATDVTLDGGLTVDFDQQFVTLGTVPVEGATTDAINITGNDSTAITTGFQIDADTGELWLRADGEWESHGEYETSNGAFQETLGDGAWMATTVTQESGSSPPSGTPEPQSIETPESTAQPQPDNPSSPAPGESSPGMTDSEDPTTPPTSDDTPTTGTSAPSSTASDGTDGPDTSNSDNSTTDGDDDSSSGDGPGFTGLAAVVAVLGTIILVRRRR